MYVLQCLCICALIATLQAQEPKPKDLGAIADDVAGYAKDAWKFGTEMYGKVFSSKPDTGKGTLQAETSPAEGIAWGKVIEKAGELGVKGIQAISGYVDKALPNAPNFDINARISSGTSAGWSASPSALLSVTALVCMSCFGLVFDLCL